MPLFTLRDPLSRLRQELEDMTEKYIVAEKEKNDLRKKLSDTESELSMVWGSLQVLQMRNAQLVNEISGLKEHLLIPNRFVEGGFRLSFDPEMEGERRLLEKRELLLTVAHRERESYLEEEKNRVRASQAEHERKMEEDRQRLDTKVKYFEKLQKEWEEEKKMAQRNYDKLQRKLNDGFQQLRRDQLELEERLQTKMDDLMEEHNNLILQEKEQKLKDLSETYLRYCEMYANDPENLTTETKFFQRKFEMQLIKLKNSMPSGEKFLPMLEAWAEGSLLNKKMLLHLSSQDEVSQDSIQCSDHQVRRDLRQILSSYSSSNALPSTTREVQAIESSFHEKLQEIDKMRSRALENSSSSAAISPAPIEDLEKTAKEKAVRRKKNDGEETKKIKGRGNSADKGGGDRRKNNCR